MPQLDFVIIFPQIFWLILTFFSFYIIIVHYFLPNFIKVMLSRKRIILQNLETLIKLENQFNKNQLILNKLLSTNFTKVKHMLEKNIIQFLDTNNSFDFNTVNLSLVNVLYSNTLYYDKNIIESIFLKPVFLN